MTQFEDFLSVALRMGMGRMSGAERQVPLFVAEGNYQSRLLKKAIEYLEDRGFCIMDICNKTYEEAVEAFSLEWPSLFEKRPLEEFSSEVKEDEKKLLIACGRESHPRFWRYPLR